MAYIPDELFDELHRELSGLMCYGIIYRDGEANECTFCMRLTTEPEIRDIEHSPTCLGLRLMQAMDREKMDKQDSG